MLGDLDGNTARRQFRYDPNSGKLTWLFDPDKSVWWNSRYANTSAGSTRKDGYVQVFAAGKLRLAHRIIWVYVNDVIPNGLTVDHVNGNPNDNRICNLRLATPTENQFNRRNAKNKLLPKGVGFNASRGLFRARIRIAGKQVTLGFFQTVAEASAAYAKFATDVHGKFMRLK